jgi:hypothetical protein
MMKRTLPLAAMLWAAFAVGCATQSEEQDAGSKVAAQAPSGAAGSVLDAYESIRADLASDQEPATSRYADLASAVRRAANDYDGTAQESLIELATAADAITDGAVPGLPDARLQFGKVSEPLIAFLSSQPELAEGRFVFECPMAKGYPKWVQASEAASNPYMGTEMASCGTATSWTP